MEIAHDVCLYVWYAFVDISVSMSGFIHGVTKNTNVKVPSNLLSVMWSKLITSSWIWIYFTSFDIAMWYLLKLSSGAVHCWYASLICQLSFVTHMHKPTYPMPLEHVCWYPVDTCFAINEQFPPMNSSHQVVDCSCFPPITTSTSSLVPSCL